MAALTMALVAGMVLGTGPDSISTEAQQRLCIDGSWEGSLEGAHFVFLSPEVGDVRTFSVKLEPGRLWVVPTGHTCCTLISVGKWVDEGRGKCKLLAGQGIREQHGIYKHESGRLFICLSAARDKRPTAFLAGEKQALLLIQRVKPPK